MAAAGRSPGTRSVRLEAARNPNYCVRVWCGPSMCEGFVVFIGDIGLALLAAMIEGDGRRPRDPRGAMESRRRSAPQPCIRWIGRSEAHTSELQSLMRSSYAVFCL